MRIALVSTPFVPVPPPGYGGTELVVAALHRALRDAGHEVVLFATGDSRAPGLCWAFEKAIRPPEPWAEVVHCRRAAELASAGGFDLVHAHAPAMAAFADRLPCPLVLTLHHAADRALERLYADAPGATLVAISERQAELVGVRVGAVVHHGLDLSLYGPAGQGGDEAFFLGRLSWAKGPDLAVAAARRARLPIVLAGKVHPEDEAPAGWLERALLPALRAPHVRAAGVADLAVKRRAFGRARALLAPLRWEEPFGLMLIEAGLAGCPVIAYPRGAAPEIVEDGVTGFLVEDVASMALALRWAAKLDCRHIQARARERFSAARMARDYLEVYRAATRGRAETGWTTVTP
ncbi:MAG: glycosyltransferase [Anaeromyxobacteraceae bacterium]